MTVDPDLFTGNLMGESRVRRGGQESSDFPEADYDDCFPSGPLNSVLCF